MSGWLNKARERFCNKRQERDRKWKMKWRRKNRAEEKWEKIIVTLKKMAVMLELAGRGCLKLFLK